MEEGEPQLLPLIWFVDDCQSSVLLGRIFIFDKRESSDRPVRFLLVWVLLLVLCFFTISSETRQFRKLGSLDS